MLYPLIFQPIFKSHPWGGRKLESLYGKKLPPGALIGESWEIADRPEGESVVANGPLAGKSLRWLMENHAAELLGSAQARSGRFPLLVKILDCRQAPSVQVHPSPETAARLGGEAKPEVWYVTDAESEAHLRVGLRRGVKRGQFERKLGEGNVVDCLHLVPVRPGDVMSVPGGRLHAIGAGTVLYEIQLNSNTTYRLFDWNRRGADGKPRELQVEQALTAADFDDIEPKLVESQFEGDDTAVSRPLVDLPEFAVEEWRPRAAHRHNLGALDRPVILGVVAGRLTVAAAGETVVLEAGRFCLIPASVADGVVMSEAEATYLLATPGVEGEDEAARQRSAEAEPRGIAPWRIHRSRQSRPGSSPAAAKAPHRRPALPSRRQIKHRLSKRLIYSPFLKMLVLLFWFRVVVLGLVLMGLTAVVTLPKLWRTTPPDFIPVVKVSLLDKLQAFALRRSAERATARGDHESAVESWRGAFGNNLGDPTTARGLLRSTTALEVIPTKSLAGTVQTGDWLLRLTSTNLADLELVCTFLDKAQLYEMAHAHLEPYAQQLSGSLKAIYVKSLFFEADFANYNQLWNDLTPDEQARPDMALIRAGYLAGWAKTDTIGEARQVLEKAAGERGPLWLLANRLQMAVSAMQMDPGRYREALQRLQDAQLDNGIDNAAYWALLATAGRKSEAVRLARDFAIPPRSPGELLRLVRVNMGLGLNDEALKLLRAYAKYFPLSEAVWTSYAALLLEAKDWETLRGVALHMRQVPAFRGRLDALGLFYEGRADLATARVDAAERAFDAATNADFRTPAQSVLAASSLLSLRYPAHARAILERAETMVTNRLQYLDLLSRAAVQLKDEALMLSSAQAMYEHAPTDPDCVNRYAAALLIRAERPEEAVRLTLELHSRFPNSSSFQINHALALLLNHRPDEAEAVLNQVIFSQLRPEEINSYYQALFELRFLKQDHAKAWQALDRVDWSQLFPTETNRYVKMRTALPPRPVVPAAPPPQ